MDDWGKTSGYMSAEDEKKLYEAIDSIYMGYVHGDEFIEVLMVMTGTTYNGGDGGPSHHPGISTDARRVVLRWLRDNHRFDATR